MRNSRRQICHCKKAKILSFQKNGKEIIVLKMTKNLSPKSRKNHEKIVNSGKKNLQNQSQKGANFCEKTQKKGHKMAQENQENTSLARLNADYDSAAERVIENLVDATGLKLNQTKREMVMKELGNAFHNRTIHILIIGATGSGKTSTIRAMFDESKMSAEDRAKLKISTNANPETMGIQSYKIGGGIVLWDSPGLGDGEKDKQHIAKIKSLIQTHTKNEGLIDLALIVLNGANLRDLSAAFNLIDSVLSELGGDSNRIVVAINKCDRASDNPTHSFDYANNALSKELEAELEEKVEQIKQRFMENKGVRLENVLYYSAGHYDEKTQRQAKPYNIDKLNFFLVGATPEKKRLVYLGNFSKNLDTNDSGANYVQRTEKGIFDSVCETISSVVEKVGEAVSWTADKAEKAMKWMVDNKETIMKAAAIIAEFSTKIASKSAK